MENANLSKGVINGKDGHVFGQKDEIPTKNEPEIEKVSAVSVKKEVDNVPTQVGK
jgi:hypothetical protein